MPVVLHDALARRGLRLWLNPAMRCTLNRLADLLPPVLADLELRPRSGGRLPTGFSELDRLTGGLRPGALWVITGPSGVGKSVLALDLARAACVRGGATTLVVTTEAASGVVRRLLAAECRVPLHHLVLGTVTDDDRTRLANRMPALTEVPLSLMHSESSGSDWLGPAADLRPRVVVLDPLPSDVSAAELSSLRSAARTLASTFVAVVEQDPADPEAQLARLGQRPDLLVELYRADQLDRDSDRAGEADLVVRQHRDGPVDTMTVAFQGLYSRFVDISL